MSDNIRTIVSHMPSSSNTSQLHLVQTLLKVNTTIAAASGVLSMGLLMRTLHKKFDAGHVSH